MQEQCDDIFLESLKPEHSLGPADDSKEFTRYMIHVIDLLHVRGCSRSLLLVVIIEIHRCKLGISAKAQQCKFFVREIYGRGCCFLRGDLSFWT